MKIHFYIIVLSSLLTSCAINPYGGTTYINKQRTPYGKKFYALTLDRANYFSFIFFNKYGTLNEHLKGEYRIDKDTVLLRIIDPIEYKIKETRVEYSEYKSPDSLYFFFFDLHPQILKVNRTGYHKVSSNVIYDCPKDTCPSIQAIDCKMIPGWAFDDTVVVSKKYYSQNHLDTLDFFDPNDELVDKKIPIVIDKYNCVKIYLALKPQFELPGIPTKFFFDQKRLFCFDSMNKKRVFRLYKR